MPPRFEGAFFKSFPHGEDPAPHHIESGPHISILQGVFPKGRGKGHLPGIFAGEPKYGPKTGFDMHIQAFFPHFLNFHRFNREI